MEHRITIDGVDTVLHCGETDTILKAGLTAKLAIPYECASGGCGACRAKLVRGNVESHWSQASGLSDRDRRRGDRILLCQSLPTSDCHISVPINSHGVDPDEEPIPDRYSGRLVSKTLLSVDTALFSVDLDSPLAFRAGQFMLFESPAGARRAYSMAHPPRPSSTVLEFVIRSKPRGTATQWLFDEATPGDAFTLEGPYGRAFAREDSTRPALCIAGGTGIAPMLSIVERLLDTKNTTAIELYVGARTSQDLVLLDRIRNLRERGAATSLSAERLIDAKAGDSTHGVRTGNVLEHVLADRSNFSDCDIYLGGPAGLVDSALTAFVREHGAPADRIFFDRFTA